MIRHTAIAALVLAMGSAGVVAYAARSGADNDALAVAQAKVSLVQAITAAEQHANGKASKAEFEHSKQGWVYDVEVVSGAKVFDVKVDANQGSVLASTEDRADHDDGHDKLD